MALVKAVYRSTERFPASEQFGLSLQMRRAVVSVISNIAEGAARRTTNEQSQFLYTARASLSELDAQNDVSRTLDYLVPAKHEELSKHIDRVSRMLQGLIESKRMR